MNIGFIGAGKVGCSLGKYFKGHGVNVLGYHDRQMQAAEEAASFTGTEAFAEAEALVCACDALFLTVPDGLIRTVAGEICQYPIEGKYICHCSGSISSEEALAGIKDAGAFAYSVHPLFAVSDRFGTYRELADAFFTLEGDPEHLDDMGKFLSEAGLRYQIIDPKSKSLYHLAAVVSSNQVLALIDAGADAVIVPHGTDTMGYTAAAVSFMLGDVPKPVVFVGAQRSSDRPSSDASSNLMAAARFCVGGNRAGVFVVMHDTPGDDSFAVHLGTRVRKMHTSRRDAFRSINVPPVAHIDRDGKITFNTEGRPVSDGKCSVSADLCTDVVLLQFYPGMDPALFRDVFMKSKGVVIEGSGLGHVNSNMVPLIKEATDRGTVVVVTSQCLNGRTNLNVYNTGRDMLNAGAVTVWDMLPETAYAKLMWVLANSEGRDAAVEMMRTPLCGEMSDRRELL